MSFFSSQLQGERLDLLRQIAPQVTRVAVLSNPAHPGEQIDWREVQRGAKRLELALQYLVVRRADDFGAAFEKIEQGRAEALLIIPDALVLSQRRRIAAFPLKMGIPMVSGWGEFTKAGGLTAVRSSHRVTAG